MTQILIVDDDQLFAHMVADRLQRAFHAEELTVCCVDSAEAALTTIAQHQADAFDILLVDHRLGPGMNGLDLIQKMHALATHADVVLLTGENDGDVSLHAYEFGVADALMKPFSPARLIWLVRSLLKRRTMRDERDWLKVLNHVTARIHQATTLEQVASELVEGGIALGFGRARVYRVEQNDQHCIEFVGFQQSRHHQVPNFRALRIPYTASTYNRLVYDSKQLHVFHGHEHGPGYINDTVDGVDAPPEIGDWVSMPLVVKDHCVGILTLDNRTQNRRLRVGQKELLELFARHASIVWEQVHHHEQEEAKHKALTLVSQARQVADQQDNPQLETFLQALYAALSHEIPCNNFIVVVGDQKSGWFYYPLHIEHGQRVAGYWHKPQDGGLVTYLARKGEPLFLPTAVADYRQKLDIPQIGAHPAQSWMGAPLNIGADLFGALIIEDDSEANHFSREQFHLLVAVTREVASAIQTAWLREREMQRTVRLTLLQRAHEALMLLAQASEDRLWYAIATLATARDGFAFDRAMLFLYDAGQHGLEGVMGIGYPSWAAAQEARCAAPATTLTFTNDVHLLQTQAVNVTPVHQALIKLQIDLNAGPTAFTEVLTSETPILVPADQAVQRLPVNFINQFGITDYALVPIKAGAVTIGVIVVDQYFQQEPPWFEFLPHLNALVNQAALAYEIRRQNRLQQQLIDLQHEIFAQPDERGLQNTLAKVAKTARAITGCDSVSIYPFVHERYPIELDGQYTIYDGFQERELATPQMPSLFMYQIIDTRTPLFVADVHQPHERGIDFSSDPVVVAEKIAAFVGVPILDQLTRQITGLLYLNYRRPQRFEVNGALIYQAQAFAIITAIALRHWHELQSLRGAREATLREVRLMQDVLWKTLEPGITEREIISSLLHRTRQILELLNAKGELSLALILREWQRSTETDATQEVRHQYYLDKKGETAETVFDVGRGLTGLVMGDGAVRHIADLSQWDGAYIDRGISSKAELDVPIKRDDGAILGVFNIESTVAHAFTDEHAAILQRISALVILLLDNLRRREGLRSLLQAATAITAPTELAGTLKAITHSIRTIVPDVSLLTIWYQDQESHHLILGESFGRHRPIAQERRNEGIVEAVMQYQEQTAIWAEEVEQEPLFQQSALIQREGIVATAAFPLRVKEKAVGALFLAFRHPHRFTELEKDLLPFLAEFAAIGIHDAQLLDRNRRAIRRNDAVFDITNAIGGHLDLKETFQRILAQLQRLFAQQQVKPCILLYDETTNLLEFAPGTRRFYTIERETDSRLLFPLDATSFAGALASLSNQYQRKLMANTGDVQRKLKYKEQPGGAEADFPMAIEPRLMSLLRETRSQFTITLFSEAQKKLLGVLFLESPEPNAFSQEDERTLWGIARQVRFVIERHQSNVEMQRKNMVASAMAWAADIAHEMGRHVARIRNQTALLNYDDTLSTDARASIHQIEEVAAELYRLKVQATLRESTTIEAVAIHPLLHEVIDPIIEQRNQRIAPRWATDWPNARVMAQPATLRWAIRNIVRNAVEAVAKEAHPRLWITTQLHGAQQIEIRIQDNGGGISDPKIRRTLFHAPTTTKGEDRGYGLIIAYDFIKRMNGELFIASAPAERGTTFVIRLPIAADNVQERINGHGK